MTISRGPTRQLDSLSQFDLCTVRHMCSSTIRMPGLRLRHQGTDAFSSHKRIMQSPQSSRRVGSFASRLAAAAAAAAGSAQTTAAVSSHQSLLSEANMQQYVQQNEQLCKLLGGSEELQVQQLLDGVINMVWRGR